MEQATVPEAKARAISLFATSSRSCGECTACCTHMGVGDLSKPANVRCEHVCESGCSIQATKPKNCSDFRCLWMLNDDSLTTEERPDKLGAMLYFEKDLGTVWVNAHFLSEAFEKNFEDTHDKVMAVFRRILPKLPGVGGVRFLRPDQVVSQEFEVDEAKYGKAYRGQNTWAQVHDSPLGPGIRVMYLYTVTLDQFKNSTE